MMSRTGVDRMFDMGFEPQIKMIMQNVRPDRQTVLFSATFPKQIEKVRNNSFSIYSTLKALPSLQQSPLSLPPLPSYYNHPYNNNNLQLAKTVLKFPLEITVGERSTVNKVCYHSIALSPAVLLYSKWLIIIITINLQ